MSWHRKENKLPIMTATLLIVSTAILSSTITAWVMQKPEIAPEVVTIDLPKIVDALAVTQPSEQAQTKEAMEFTRTLMHAGAITKLPAIAKKHHVVIVSPQHVLGARDWTKTALDELKTDMHAIHSKKSSNEIDPSH